MKLKEINELTNNMLSTFINEIGLDGDYFISNKTCPIVFADLMGYCGDYISPQYQNELGIVINSLGDSIDDKAKKIIRNRGIIRINNQYKKVNDLNPDFLITIIHEKIHSYRNLLVFDARLGSNLSSYLSNGNKFEQNNSNYESFSADASQEILKGTIDNSIKTINKYKNKTLDELDDLEFADEKLNQKMDKQQVIDEALVELMAILAYKLYKCKEKNKEINIWNELEKIVNSNLDEDIKNISELILKHHDFELFYWMLDPLTYQNGDIHYDFFSNYAKDDKEILNKIYNLNNLGIDDDLFDKAIKSRQI